MIHVVAAITVREGCLEKFITIFKANIPAVEKESGFIEYIPTVDIQTTLPVQEMHPNVVTILEKWESREALYAHLETPHMKKYSEDVKALVESVSLQILQSA